MKKSTKPRDRTPLPAKARRIIKAQSLVYASQVSRYIHILETIAISPSLSAARTLTDQARQNMTPGTLAWAHTSQLLTTPSAKGFCSFCGSALYGSSRLPRPSCPLEAIDEPCHV